MRYGFASSLVQAIGYIKPTAVLYEMEIKQNEFMVPPL